jgi:hypothetical protein
MVWIRDSFTISAAYDFGKKVIFGHTQFYGDFEWLG